MSQRLVVFIDSQNVYMRARTIFNFGGADHPVGQIDPLKVGNLLAAKLGADYELSQVRIYRGIPSNEIDPNLKPLSSFQGRARGAHPGGDGRERPEPIPG